MNKLYLHAARGNNFNLVFESLLDKNDILCTLQCVAIITWLAGSNY